MISTGLRVSRRALIASTLGVASLCASTSVIHNDSPAAGPQEKLPIYPIPEPEILLLETPSTLETQIGATRRKLTGAYNEALTSVHGVISKWIGIEHAVENRVKSIISPTESLTPGLLYVGIATLSGSILARNRYLPSRLLLPPTFLIISLHHFLPQTTANLTQYTDELEERYFPEFARKHAVARAHTRMTWDMLKDKTEEGRDGVRKALESAVMKAQGLTGLKLKETLGWGQQQVAVMEKKIDEVRVVAEKKLDEASEVVTAKAEEVKRLV